LRIIDLLAACTADPFKGIGKPEPLKQTLKGFWSRRITAEHRLVYRVTDERIMVLQCRYHYE
jgi:toxin YoeB